MFKLYKQRGTGEDGHPIWEAVANLNATDVAGSGQTDSEGKFTVDETITLNNLKDGTYKIEEVSPPAGYVIMNDTPVTFTVSQGAVVNSDNRLTEGVIYEPIHEAVADDPATTDIDESKPAVDTDTYTIPNTPGAALPATGGMGTKFHYIFGAAMILLAGALLLLKRKRDDKAA